MIGDLGIVGLLCNYNWQLGNCWVSSSALHEYVVVLQNQKIVVCILYRAYTVTNPHTEHGRSADIVRTFHRHGADDTWLAVQQFSGILNKILRNLLDFHKLLVTCTVHVCMVTLTR